MNLPFIGTVTSETSSSYALGSGRTGSDLQNPVNSKETLASGDFHSVFDEVSGGEYGLLQGEAPFARVNETTYTLDAEFTEGAALIDTLATVTQSAQVGVTAEPAVAPTPLVPQEIPQTGWTASQWLHPQDNASLLTFEDIAAPTVVELDAAPVALENYQPFAISDAAKPELSTFTVTTSGAGTQSQQTSFSRLDAVVAPAGQELVAQSNRARSITEPLGSDVSHEDPGIKTANEKIDTLSKTGKFADDLTGLLLADSKREQATPVISKRGSETMAAIQGLAAQSINHPSATYTTPSQVDTAGLMAARTPMGTDAWGRDIGEKVLWMAAQNLTEAEIQLDPPELGPLQARISVQNDQAQVSFNSSSALVREALDQTAQRLRDMFSSEGLNLIDVNVSDQRQQGRSEYGDEAVANNDLAAETGNEAVPESITSRQVLSSQFIVDQFV